MFAIAKFILVCGFTLVLTDEDYWKERDAFIKHEESQMLGSSIILSEKEELVNKVLMGHKLQEYDAGFEQPGIFAPGKHYFNARDDIEKSKVFQFLQKVPKGAALHGHDTALVSHEYVHNLTFSDDLYACTVNGRLRLLFLSHPEQDTTCNWTLINTLRNQDPSYDDWVQSQITLHVDNPREDYPNINVAWKAINDIFETVTPMLTYRPVFLKHFYQALEELYQDNVMYLEFRGTLPTVYELNGTTYSPMEIAEFYQEVIEQFKRDRPDFVGARFIYAPVRLTDNATVESYIEIVKELKFNYPELLAGFDLVGQEDIGAPLVDFIDLLQGVPSDIDFIFHSAETNWYGTSTDLNLVDAVLLGTKRIGHGFGLVKHPLVMEVVKEKEIAVEVCPISNQVLMLVEDMRNHPAAYLIAQGYPVVISYDDPSFWSTKGLSYDFYMAFMGIASRNADLKLLKQLALNSLVYSTLPANEKKLALEAWERQWDIFLDQILEDVKTSGPADKISYIDYKHNKIPLFKFGISQDSINYLLKH